MLNDRDAREVSLAGHAANLYLGHGPAALEVVHLTLEARPTITLLRDLLKERMGRRVSPVLIVASWGDGRAAVCGPTEHNAVEFVDLPATQVESIAEKALDADNRHQAIRIIHQLLPQLDEPIPGLRNGGLFALHELQHGVPRRSDWQAATKLGAPVGTSRGRRLLNQLGYQIEELPGPAMILVAEERKKAVAVLVDQPEEIDASSDRFDGVSPVSYALAQADRENLDFVIVLAASTVRAYPAKPGVGSGRRGRSETFIEVNLDLLREDQAAYLWLLFSASALGDEGSFHEILSRSEDYAAELGRRLRQRVYEEVVPGLATAIGHATLEANPSQGELRHVYELALRVLYRLLFVAYAEDRDLLPLHTSNVYREHSLKRIAQRLADADQRGVEWGDEEGLWTEVRQIWRAVSRGNPEWDVPAYNGSLFSADPETSPLGAELDAIVLPDREVAAAMRPLLLAETGEGSVGPVDFRSLGVREFGTIYEGLLESELSVAESDLKVDTGSGAYLPADEGDELVVPAGELYLHNQSGARKATGSYYTKSFAVEHLLDRALEPALAEHLDRLSELPDREAGRRFFEFRVADIAMGSGHFLVAAIDRLERRLVSYLAERSLPDVTDELNRLRRVAHENLGEAWAGDPIEDAQLIRRQIARRCIFGVDLNPMAVELARVSIWIHTFVPGLPLSLMDQNLLQGNALVGIATFDEASELLAESGSLFSFVGSERLAAVQEPLQRLARLTDANDAEIQEARALYQELRQSTQSEAELLSVLAASRTNQRLHEAVLQGQVATQVEDQGDAFWQGLVSTAGEELEGLDVFHFPLAFPHVFLRDRKGFDVILGNPPWEEATVEEDQFWNRRFPGLRGQVQEVRERLLETYRHTEREAVDELEGARAEAESIRRVLTSGAFPGMGTGDPDLYKAFAWRFWSLVSPKGGSVGLVFPRSIFATKGSEPWRRRVLGEAKAEVEICKNREEWLFTDVNPGYSIVFFSARRDARETPEIRVRGTFQSEAEFLSGGAGATLSFEDLERLDPNLGLPALESAEEMQLLRILLRKPRLGDDSRGDFKAVPVTELHATHDKDLFGRGDHPVHNHLNVGHFNFELDAGAYAWADFDEVAERVIDKRRRTGHYARSPFSLMPSDWNTASGTHPILHDRIVFRDVVHASNPRKVWAAVAPPRTILTNKAPYLIFPRGTIKDEAWLLGHLNSSLVDWVGHLKVVLNLNFFILNALPIPERSSGPAAERLIELVASLAQETEVELPRWNELGVGSAVKREEAVAEIDALASLFFSVPEDLLRLIWRTDDELRPSLALVKTFRSRWRDLV